ncbi:precorrin-8X methylmutase [Stappia taiwanensis]|uniref:Precorrin-8X methylmutase n=1 Tax=Stappia taiwanensis TaxID=992267 RepID=A0A838Y0N0_9HYPH|nr:precorrin-8X methylmutase [Stappia taiwanensis]MBA4612613.1 precorrin-8X methylmutase [Stappia taiwanensis]GGE89055.1 precorrin-8X methylmutase [Stappia taiwanensis]
MSGRAPVRYDYEKDPAAIYRQSFAIVRAEADLERIPAELHPAAIRLIHACGMPGVIADLAWSDGVAAKVAAALRGGAPVFTDVRMVAEGIIASRLPAQNPVRCLLNDPRTPDLAARLGTTRSAAAVDLWREELAGAVVVIGNAPTALFHLLERIGEGFPQPAAILGFPVGFVGAAESKEALIANPFAIPYLALRGRHGGSAMAAAALNALAGGVPEEAPR